MRRARHQLQSNTPVVNARQYITDEYFLFQILDHLITELDNRFEEAAAGIVGAQILPSEFCSA